jgi:hypothetical protein
VTNFYVGNMQWQKTGEDWMTTVSIILRSSLTYLLTPWSRVLLEKLTVNFAASQEIPRIYETQKFLTLPTSARHLSFTAA